MVVVVVARIVVLVVRLCVDAVSVVETPLVVVVVSIGTSVEFTKSVVVSAAFVLELETLKSSDVVLSSPDGVVVVATIDVVVEVAVSVILEVVSLAAIEVTNGTLVVVMGTVSVELPSPELAGVVLSVPAVVESVSTTVVDVVVLLVSNKALVVVDEGVVEGETSVDKEDVVDSERVSVDFVTLGVVEGKAIVLAVVIV